MTVVLRFAHAVYAQEPWRTMHKAMWQAVGVHMALIQAESTRAVANAIASLVFRAGCLEGWHNAPLRLGMV